MRKRIYLSLLAIGFACMAVTMIIYSVLVWHSMQGQAEEELKNTMTVLTTGMKQVASPLTYLQETGHAEKGIMRITWIGPDGNVLYESDYDRGTMENHLERPEVQQAIRTGSGSAVRNSQTLSKMLYYQAGCAPGRWIRTETQHGTGFPVCPFCVSAASPVPAPPVYVPLLYPGVAQTDCQPLGAAASYGPHYGTYRVT